jgi:hypothetical protein
MTGLECDQFVRKIVDARTGGFRVSGLLRALVAAIAALTLSMSPALAEELGMFQTTDRKMDFVLSTCGNGEDLCVKLAAARGSAATRQVKPYIGKFVVNKAKAAGTNTWRGTMRFGKHDVTGTMKLGKNFVMSGCAMIVMCDDITLVPAK